MHKANKISVTVSVGRQLQPVVHWACSPPVASPTTTCPLHTGTAVMLQQQCCGHGSLRNTSEMRSVGKGGSDRPSKGCLGGKKKLDTIPGKGAVPLPTPALTFLPGHKPRG